MALITDTNKVQDLRRTLLSNGYGLVAVRSNQKVPLEKGWEISARAKRLPFPNRAALSTGIICDELRAVDIDIDEAELAEEVARLSQDLLGTAPQRTRGSSSRVLFLYRALEGSPAKLKIGEDKGRGIEVLGHGQQFVAFGIHPSGEEYSWPGISPLTVAKKDLPAVSQEEIIEFLTAAARIIGVEGPVDRVKPVAMAQPRAWTPHDVSSEIEELLTYIDASCSYDQWKDVLMGIHDAMGGSAEGLAIADRWSATSSKYPGTKAIERKWHSFTPGGGITKSTIAEMARAAGADLGAIASKYMEREEPSAEELRNNQQSVENIWKAFEAKRRAMIEAEQTDLRRLAKGQLEWFDDVQPVILAPYIVKGVLDEGTMSVVYGPSNSGKTFFTLDLAYHVAINAQWRDRRVNGGAVLYLAAEGGNGIANRVAALKKSHGIVEVPFALRRAGLDLLKPDADVKLVLSLAKEVALRAPLKLIVVDTLSRVIAGGDENTPGDMTAFIKNIETIQHVTGAHILIVHHTGKDVARGARGHSSLRAATDTEIELVVDEFSNRFAKVTKQREYEGGEEFGFTLKPVHLGEDQDGDPVATCIVEAVEATTAGGDDMPPMAVCRRILEDVQVAWNKGNPYSMTAQSQRTGRYAPRALSKKFGIREGAMDRLLKSWLDNEIIIMGTFDPSNNRKGLSVIGSLDAG